MITYEHDWGKVEVMPAAQVPDDVWAEVEQMCSAENDLMQVYGVDKEWYGVGSVAIGGSGEFLGFAGIKKNGLGTRFPSYLFSSFFVTEAAQGQGVGKAIASDTIASIPHFVANHGLDLIPFTTFGAVVVPDSASYHLLKSVGFRSARNWNVANPIEGKTHLSFPLGTILD